MNLRKHTLLTAWLGLVAMWLVVLAPLVSQLVAAHYAHVPTAALCSSIQPDSTATHLSHDNAFGACGYCDLLEHHVAMPGVPMPEPTRALVATLDRVAPLSTRHTPFGAFPSGRPRAPPLVS
ncbi:DUF2946 domain-containing protein [Paraburkholderia tagetis]|uniref:DUF2946 domain-containing protein n=1 Tax=Paraburkholderia tagetis TaxID=2913261 RepID=A0A9X1RNV2_9BURK|nr:DUF2946 domain-containing protein [Paraburkholderia tagetis]MCG5072483.1 DUF2946 domain-containing protein [Paraburkholderia tagetis]